jgi:hypothetical protein
MSYAPNSYADEEDDYYTHNHDLDADEEMGDDPTQPSYSSGVGGIGGDIMDEDEELEEGEELETQESVWEVIGAFFKEKGLVRQQLDSFNVFIKTTMQELVDDTPEIRLQYEQQHKPGGETHASEEDEHVSITIVI